MAHRKHKILILGGGQAQLDLIRTSKKIGLYTIVVGIEGNYPGYKSADKVYHVDITDKEQVLEIAKSESIDGICMVCSDFGLETLGYVCDNLKLRGLSENSAKTSSNKFLMKTLLNENQVPTARFITIRRDDNVKEAIKGLRFPLMVKAVDLQGSKGVYKCDTLEELLNSSQLALSLSKKDYCIIEEFIEGEEFGAQAFVLDGEILFIQAHGDEVWRNNDSCIPIGHYMPYAEDNPTLQNKIKEAAEKSIKAMGFNNCAVNIDFILKDGIPYVIELTGRAGANFLPEVTSYFLGVDYYNLILLNAINDDPLSYFNSTTQKKWPYVMSRQLFSLKKGVIAEIEAKENNNIKICTLFKEKGEEVNEFKNSSDCIGKVLCVGQNYEECDDIIRNFLKKDLTIKLQ